MSSTDLACLAETLCRKLRSSTQSSETHTKKTENAPKPFVCKDLNLEKVLCVTAGGPHLDAGARRWHSTDQARGEGAVRWMYLVTQGNESF